MPVHDLFTLTLVCDFEHCMLEAFFRGTTRKEALQSSAAGGWYVKHIARDKSDLCLCPHHNTGPHRRLIVRRAYRE